MKQIIGNMKNKKNIQQILKTVQPSILRERSLSDGSKVWSVAVSQDGKEIEFDCINEKYANLLLDAILLYTI